MLMTRRRDREWLYLRRKYRRYKSGFLVMLSDCTSHGVPGIKSGWLPWQVKQLIQEHAAIAVTPRMGRPYEPHLRHPRKQRLG